jgi:acyl transferase domain-containing protein
MNPMNQMNPINPINPVNPVSREYSGNEIAIIGIACRFPQSPDWRVFWQNLLQGRELIRFFSRDQLLAQGIASELIDQAGYVPAKAALEDADCFDYRFFGYSQREAQKMDPQLRVLHEVCHNALSDAGITPGDELINAGVFLGSTLNLERMQLFAGASADLAEMFDVSNYNDPAAFATQIAYRMKLTGPAMHVQTACSTSLSAIHLACKALLAGECSLALAGGACITDPVAGGYLYRDGMILSPDGHCKTFSDQGQGTVNGNGAGVVLLKLLEEALADGDPIHAIIVESGMNNDADRKVSFEAPSIPGQAEVVRRVYELAEVAFSSLGLIEAHGTATVLGDPIEIQALNQVAHDLLSEQERAGFRCAIGSVKSNLGHLDAAAGVAGLIKAALAVRFGKIPPSLHFERPNPHLGLDQTPFYVPTAAKDWPPSQLLRRAGVSSFGIGGTNVHVLLEQAPASTALPDSTPLAQLLPLSAASPQALLDLVRSWQSHLQLCQPNHAELSAIANALAKSDAARDATSTTSSRACLLASTGTDWQQQLAAWQLLDAAKPLQQAQVWLFPGQGSQSAHMGLALAARFPAFGRRYHALLGQAETLLALAPGALELDLHQPEAISTLHLQPLLYALQTALGLWLGDVLGRPDGVCGYSLGEFAAAAVAGVLSPETGMELVVERARLMESMPRGAMFAAGRKPGFDGKFPSMLWCIAEPAPGSWTLACAENQTEAVQAWLAAEGFTWRRIAVSHAFHTPLVEPAAQAFGALLRKVTLQAPACPVYSTALGRKLAAHEMSDPAYWVQQMLSPIQFGAALQSLQAELAQSGQQPHLLQIGAGIDLLQHARKWLALSSDHLLPTLGNAAQEVESTLQSLASLWNSGAPIRWDTLTGSSADKPDAIDADADQDTAQARALAHLPGYAFERQVCPPLLTGNTQAQLSVASLFFGQHYHDLRWEAIAAPGATTSTSNEWAAPATWLLCRQAGERERALLTTLTAAGSPGQILELFDWDGNPDQLDTRLQERLTQAGLSASAQMDVVLTGLLDPLNPTQAQFWSFWLPLALARWSMRQHPTPTMRLLFAVSNSVIW